MNCEQAGSLLSPYLDGVLNGREMRAVYEHLAVCDWCRRHFAGLRQAQQLTVSLGPRRAPADLPLRLRLALSQELAKSPKSYWRDLSIRAAHVRQAFLMPITAGLVSAFVLLALVIGFFALPTPMAANDIPTVLYTPPQLRSSPVGFGSGAAGTETIVVEAYIDASGRVQDYRVLSGPRTVSQYLPQLNNLLIFSVFRPATAFGKPVSGKVVLSFAGVSVTG